MNSWLFTLFIVVILQRIRELQMANHNSRWMKRQGGVEVGQAHYPWLVFMHVLFFISILIERMVFSAQTPNWWLFPVAIFAVVQFLRIRCIRSLGRYWNTRIWILPHHDVQVKGPYIYLRHPNYLVVICEIAIFPLIFGAYFTTVLFTIANLLFLLKIRIPIEEKALLELTNYEQQMGKRKRFIPSVK